MNIYVASSWRNTTQPIVVQALRDLDHVVYDFRDDDGFHWSEIDPTYKGVGEGVGTSPAQYVEMLAHPLAKRGYARDIEALDECDLCVLVLPCGKSAHLELGRASGRGSGTAILCEDPMQPELMYGMADHVAVDLDDLLRFVDTIRPYGYHAEAQR